MKKKWIISAGVVLSLGALATVALAERGGQMRAHGQPTPWMLERLDLTDAQQEQLQALRKEQREAMRQQREAMVAMHKEQREAVMNLLTKEQQEALKEMRGKFFDRRGNKGKGRHDMRHGNGRHDARHGNGRPDMWHGKDRHDMRHGGKDARRGDQGAFSRLDLTDEQKEQLKALREGHRTEMRETRKNHRAALENVLTEEQREKLDAMKDEAFYGGRRWRGKR